MLAGSIATGRPATAPSHAGPTSDSSHTAIQPQTTTDSVETELVALDVLHHEARLVVAIGRQ